MKKHRLFNLFAVILIAMSSIAICSCSSDDGETEEGGTQTQIENKIVKQLIDS